MTKVVGNILAAVSLVALGMAIGRSYMPLGPADGDLKERVALPGPAISTSAAVAPPSRAAYAPGSPQAALVALVGVVTVPRRMPASAARPAECGAPEARANRSESLRSSAF